MKKQYKEPEEMIDHNGNLDTVSGLMSIFFAYNQRQADDKSVIINYNVQPVHELTKFPFHCVPSPFQPGPRL